MLTIEDTPTIRNAIIKRLDKEPGVAVADIKIEGAKDHIKVGVWLMLTDTQQAGGIVDIRSFFDLPDEFEIGHLHNEIDEIAEHCKKARLKTGVGRILFMPGVDRKREFLTGTGLRGWWPQ